MESTFPGAIQGLILALHLPTPLAGSTGLPGSAGLMMTGAGKGLSDVEPAFFKEIAKLKYGRYFYEKFIRSSQSCCIHAQPFRGHI